MCTSWKSGLSLTQPQCNDQNQEIIRIHHYSLIYRSFSNFTSCPVLYSTTQEHWLPFKLQTINTDPHFLFHLLYSCHPVYPSANVVISSPRACAMLVKYIPRYFLFFLFLDIFICFCWYYCEWDLFIFYIVPYWTLVLVQNMFYPVF